MTLVNLVLTPQRVMLVTDTLMVHKRQPWGFTTKFALMPHCHAVLAARGAVEALQEPPAQHPAAGRGPGTGWSPSTAP